MNEQSLHTDTVNDWIIGYLTNSLTQEEMQLLQDWLNISEENRKYFSDMQEVWIAASDEADGLNFNIIFRTYRGLCKTAGKTESISHTPVDVCCCHGYYCFCVCNNRFSEWEESTPKPVDTYYC